MQKKKQGSKIGRVLARKLPQQGRETEPSNGKRQECSRQPSSFSFNGALDPRLYTSRSGSLRKTIPGIGLQEAKMPFYVVRDRGTGRFLSLLEDGWVKDLREAAVFSQRRTATSSIRVAWQGRCVVERIERLPDRIGLARRPRRHSTLPRPVLDQIW